MVATPIARSLRRGHIIQWRTASALWRPQQPRANFHQPAILRFTSDRFMEQFMAIASQAPHRLGEWQVLSETWRKLAPVPSLQAPPSELLPVPANNPPVKLYQPAHERYYLVTASLVCRQPGLPDKALNLGQREKVSFVVRRRLRPEGEDLPVEHAWVDGGWQPVEHANQLASGEETQPMFPTTYQEPDGYRRCLFAGLVPVTERERYLTAPRRSAPVDPVTLPDIDDKIDRLVTLFNVDVLAPWRELLRQVGNPFPDGRITPISAIGDEALEPDSATGKRPIDNLGPLTQTIWESLRDGDVNRSSVRDTTILQRDQLQLSSWYGLLDFANYLKTYLPRLWEAIQDERPANLPSAQQKLYEELEQTEFRPGATVSTSSPDYRFYELVVGRASGGSSVSLIAALKDVLREEVEDFLEDTTVTYNAAAAADANSNPDTDNQNWPELPFLLCGRDMRELVNALDDSRDPVTGELIQSPGLIHRALEEETDPGNGSVPQTPLAQEVSRSARASDVAENQFVIRCVYERPGCPASLQPTVVSEPTVEFRLAAYYDPDAPARPIRIPMPLDTTPAGLRKYAKNTMFVISDTLGCQIERAKSITFGDLVRSVLPWPFHKDFDTGKAGCSAKGSLDFGKLCTLSIPIITICALIILIIFVLLLDIIFRWVPYLIFCLPIPGLKAKGENE